jgi:hypothetical protein
MLAMALLGDLVLLPALLAGPLGCLFLPRKTDSIHVAVPDRRATP